MGSHGGASPEGQKKVLASYGITEETMGAPIEADMEVVQLGTTKSGARLTSARLPTKQTASW